MKEGVLVQMVFAIVLFFVAFVIACLNLKGFRSKAKQVYVIGVKMLMYFCGGVGMFFGVIMALCMFLIEDDL